MLVEKFISKVSAMFLTTCETLLPVFMHTYTGLTPRANQWGVEWLYIRLLCIIFVSPLPLQCSPDYKVPGLYVIDSIVRQSRNAVSCVLLIGGEW